MLEYLVVLLDYAAISFCNYKNPYNDSKFISQDSLKDIILFAQKENLGINFVYGKTRPSLQIEELVKTVKHVKIVPIELAHIYKDAIILMNCDNLNSIKNLKDDNLIILNVEKSELSELAINVKKLDDKFQRLNILLQDVDLFLDRDFDIYKEQLHLLNSIIINGLITEKTKEINVVLDRVILSDRNHCDAGLKHITFAPNGKFYLCPAFFYDNDNESVGDLSDGIKIKNKQLLKTDYSPICRRCDAYQCKRCQYLNKKTTGEINTPSHEQCVVAHLERNNSNEILKELKELNFSMFKNKEIPEINYLDPFDLINENHEQLITPTIIIC